jgi:ankyrin repeat protein
MLRLLRASVAVRPVVKSFAVAGLRTKTAVDLSTKVNRVSFQDTRAGELIAAVQNHNYGKATRLVSAPGGVHVDAHTPGENTPLTDAAKRGDVAALRFLLSQLHANPHASCDCPSHRTACHYAAKYGHLDAMRCLIEHGADPRVKDASGYAALDYAAPGLWESLTSSSADNEARFGDMRRLLLAYAETPSRDLGLIDATQEKHQQQLKLKLKETHR